MLCIIALLSFLILLSISRLARRVVFGCAVIFIIFVVIAVNFDTSSPTKIVTVEDKDSLHAPPAFNPTTKLCETNNKLKCLNIP